MNPALFYLLLNMLDLLRIWNGLPFLTHSILVKRVLYMSGRK